MLLMTTMLVVPLVILSLAAAVTPVSPLPSPTKCVALTVPETSRLALGVCGANAHISIRPHIQAGVGGLRAGGDNKAPGHLQRRRRRRRPHPQQPPAGHIRRITRAGNISLTRRGSGSGAQAVLDIAECIGNQGNAVEGNGMRHAAGQRQHCTHRQHMPLHGREFSTQSPASIGRGFIPREGVCPCCQPRTGSVRAG